VTCSGVVHQCTVSNNAWANLNQEEDAQGIEVVNIIVKRCKATFFIEPQVLEIRLFAR
jgi:hypothetical protein